MSRRFLTSSFAVLVLLALLFGSGLWWTSTRTPGAPAVAGGDAPGVEGVSPDEVGTDPRTALSGAEADSQRLAVEGDSNDPARIGAPDPDERALRGTVVDRTGAPVEGAELWAADRPGPPVDYVGVSARIETTTAADGSFELRGLRPDLLRIAVRADGFAPWREDAFPIPRGPEHELEPIVLERGALLAGHVRDSAGSGVAGAVLTLVEPDLAEPLALSGFRPPALATTDGNGRFEIDQLACGPWSIEVGSPHHPKKVFEGAADRPGELVSGLVFELDDGTSIEGYVVGAPEGSFVRLEVRAEPSSEEGRDAPPSTAGRRAAAVGPDGAFALGGLAVDLDYDLQLFELSAADSKLGSLPRSERVPALGGDRDVVIPYQRGSGVTFRVVDDATGLPLTDFLVAYGTDLHRPLIGPEGEPRTHHPGGWVRLHDLGAASEGELLRLTIRADGYATYDRDDIELVAGDEAYLGELRLAPIPRLRVVVRSASTREPIAGATVSVSVQDARPMAAAERRLRHAFATQWPGMRGMGAVGGAAEVVRTDERGVADVDAPRGVASILRVESPLHAALEVADLVLPVSEPVVEREVFLLDGGAVIVQALDSKGRPRAGVRIERRSPQERDGMRLPMPPGVGPRHVTDGEGRTTFSNLEDGIHGFRVAKRSAPTSFGGGPNDGRMEGPGEGSWIEVRVADGATANAIVREAPHGVLRGVVSEGGVPLAGANLSMSRIVEVFGPVPAAPAPTGVGAGPKSRTNGEGRYELRDLEAGRYRLRVTHASRAMAEEVELLVEEGDNVLDVELASTEIRGAVTDAAGRPLAGVRVVAHPDGDRPPYTGDWSYTNLRSASGLERTVQRIPRGGAAAEARTDAEGRYALKGIAAGRAVVVVARGGSWLEAASGPVTVEAGEVREGVDLRLEVGGSIEVTATASDGSPGRSCIVEAWRRDGADLDRRVGYIASGSTEIEGLAPGPWSVRVLQQGPASPEHEGAQEVDVVAGETSGLTFQVP